METQNSQAILEQNKEIPKSYLILHNVGKKKNVGTIIRFEPVRFNFLFKYIGALVLLT